MKQEPPHICGLAAREFPVLTPGRMSSPRPDVALTSTLATADTMWRRSGKTLSRNVHPTSPTHPHAAAVLAVLGTEDNRAWDAVDVANACGARSGSVYTIL